jgi:dTDP-4-amino-4,6-dideoxygalactose transaminase
MGFVAPAGIRLSFGDLTRGAFRSLSRAAAEDLAKQLSERAARERAWLVSTGRAAMALAFEAMKRAAGDPRRVEVIFPGYTCYSVPASVERAGLVPRICDVDPTTFNPDFDSLADIDFGRVLAIVSANLYGLPNALQDMEELARKHGIFMLDDAAQALGACYQGRPVGAFGDVGLFSFDKGKNITTLQGGVLVADPGRLSEALEIARRDVLQASPSATVSTLLKLPVYALMLRPWLYGAVRRLPLGLGLTPYEVDYPIAPFSRSLAGLASVQLERLDEITGIRLRNSARLREALTGVPGISMPRVLPGAEPVYRDIRSWWMRGNVAASSRRWSRRGSAPPRRIPARSSTFPKWSVGFPQTSDPRPVPARWRAGSSRCPPTGTARRTSHSAYRKPRSRCWVLHEGCPASGPCPRRRWLVPRYE